jgi:hypothetical protein
MDSPVSNFEMLIARPWLVMIPVYLMSFFAQDELSTTFSELSAVSELKEVRNGYKIKRTFQVIFETV